MRTCDECGQSALVDATIVLKGVVICANCKPIALAKMQGGQIIGGAGIWREGKVLVMGSRAVLPTDRCIKCDAPSDGRPMKRKLYWHPPAWYLLVLINLLVYAVVAMAVRKKAEVYIGLCSRHRTRRFVALCVGWGGFLAAIGMFAIGLGNNWPLLVVSAVVVLLVSLIWGTSGSRVILTRKIQPDLIRIGGVGGDFLARLAQFEARTS